MEDNIVQLLSKLSNEIVKNELSEEDESDQSRRRKQEQDFKKSCRKVCQKGFDVLLGKSTSTSITDPCITDYGAKWDPSILILDYGFELEKRGAAKSNEELIYNMKLLAAKPYFCIDEMIKLLLLLKGPYSEYEHESEFSFSFTGTDFFFKPTSMLSMVPDSVLSIKMNTSTSSNKSFHKEASFYNTNWSSSMSSGFLLLDKFSDFSGETEFDEKTKENCFYFKMPDENFADNDVEADTVILKSSKREVSLSRRKSSSSQKHCFDIDNINQLNKHSLLDHFVENPISHKLPDGIVQKKSKSLQTPTKIVKRTRKNFRLLPEVISNTSSIWDSNEKDILKNDDILEVYSNFGSKKTILESIEELAYSSKKGSSYQDMYENCLGIVNYESNMGLYAKSGCKKNIVCGKSLSGSFFESSNDVILSLWERDFSLLQQFRPELSDNWPVLRKVELSEYVHSVKFLLTGISTKIFKYDPERAAFVMACGTCIEGVTPESLYDFSKEFLEIGTCYTKLSTAAINNGKQDSCNCRIISQAFWKGVFEFLESHYCSVLLIPDSSNLLGLKATCRKLHAMITTVAGVCKVFQSDVTLPQGGQLITYMLRLAVKLHKKYVQNVIFGILKICCDVYIKWLLQTWIFQGEMGHQCHDFFVEHRVDKAKTKDRSYYLSFYMYNERLPSFLSGLECSLFNCGKTVHLLKLFNPDNKFCQLLEQDSYPKMRLCLSEKDYKILENDFEKYARDVLQLCGAPVTVATIRNEEKARDEEYEMEIRMMQRVLIEKKRSEHLLLLEERKAKKEVQRKIFKEQVEFAEMQKQQKRLKEEAENKKIEEEIKKRLDKENSIIEEEKIKMKMYYEELLNTVEKRQKRAEWRKKRLLLYDKRVSFLSKDGKMQNEEELLNVMSNNNSMDLPNDNETATAEVDDEGNIVYKNLAAEFDDETNANIDKTHDKEESEEHANEQLDKLRKIRFEYQGIIDSNYEALGLETDSQNNRNSFLTDASKFYSQETSLSNQTEAQRCKRKVLESEYGLGDNTPVVVEVARLEETEAQKNKKKVLESEFNLINSQEKSEKSESGKEETEAQKNKKKILNCEYNLVGISGKTDGRTLPQEETEAQRNKRKVLESEFNLIEITKDGEKTISIQSNQEKAEESQAQKNRRRVLGSEINVVEDSETNEKTTSEKLTREKHKEKEAPKIKKEIVKADYSCLNFPQPEKGKSKTQEDTEAQRNRKKIMQSDLALRPTENIEKRKPPNSLALVLHKDNKNFDLEGQNDTKSKENKWRTPESGSASSFESGSSCNSFVTAPSPGEVVLRLTSAELEEDAKTPAVKNKIFRESLDVDAEWFGGQKKCKNIFTEVVNYDQEQEISEFAKTEFTEFEKYLRQSVALPLKVHERLANEALLKHFLKEEKLLSHLNSLRCYFFLNDGEFGRSLTHNTFHILSKCTEPQQFFERNTLTNIVNEALNYTIHNSEPNSQNLSFKIVEMPQFLNHSSHNVLSPFELSYQVKWPLNIILTDKALGKYKIIFQFLLKLKRISWTLNENFLYLTCWYKDKRVNGKVLINSPHYHKIQIYRHAMAQFIITLEDYVSSNGLQLSWINFLKDLETAENLDHLYQKHVRYIKDVLRRCFLTKYSQELLNYIHGLIELGLKFHYTVKSSLWVLVDGKYQHPKFSVLKTTFHDFCNLTKDFMKTLRKKIGTNHELKSHCILLEKFDMKLS